MSWGDKISSPILRHPEYRRLHWKHESKLQKEFNPNPGPLELIVRSIPKQSRKTYYIKILGFYIRVWRTGWV